MAVEVKMKMTPKQAGAMYVRAIAMEEKLKEYDEFIKWCVDNWVCDTDSEEYTENFCSSPSCRRCSAMRVLTKREQ